MVDNTVGKIRKLSAGMGRMFIIGSVLGWAGEAGLYILLTGRFINRGFLHGPWMPIYGAGCVAFMLMGRLWKAEPRAPAIFVMGVAAAGLLEYFTGAALESMFEMRWWDYGVKFLAIDRRIWFPALMLFSGLGTCIALNAGRLRRAPGPDWAYCFAALTMVCDIALSIMEPNTGATIASAI